MNAERASVDIKVRARHGSAVGRFARAFTRARSLDAEGDGVGMVASTSSGRRRGTLPGLGVGGLLHAEKEDHVSGETTLIHGFLMKKARSKKGSWLGPLQRHNWQERYVALMLPETPYATSSKLLYFHLDNHDEVADAMGVITICRDTTVTPHVSRHGYKHCFYVSGGHGKDKRGVALRASSETEYQKWVTAIRDLCHTLHAEDDDDVSGDDGDGSDEEEEQEMVVMKGEVEEEKESGASKKKEASSAADSSSGGGNWTAKPEFSIALISAAVAVILALAYGPMRAHPSGRFGAFALGLFSALVLVVAPALLLWEGDARGDGGDESAAVKAKEARACLVVKKEKTRREKKVRKKRDGKAKAVQTSTAQVRTEEAMSFVGVEDFGNVVKEDAAEVLSLVLGEAYGDNTAAAVVEEKTRTSIFGMTTGSKKNKSSPRLASEVADWFVRRSSAEDRLTMAWRYFRFNHGDVHRAAMFLRTFVEFAHSTIVPRGWAPKMTPSLLRKVLRRGALGMTGERLRTKEGYRVGVFNPANLCEAIPDVEELGMTLNLMLIIMSNDDNLGGNGFKNIIELGTMTFSKAFGITRINLSKLIPNDAYCARMHGAMIVNPPAWTSWLWSISKHFFPPKLHKRVRMCKGDAEWLLSTGVLKLKGAKKSGAGIESLPVAVGGKTDVLIEEFCDTVDLSGNPWMRTLLGNDDE